jgi:hypothetical protein
MYYKKLISMTLFLTGLALWLSGLVLLLRPPFIMQLRSYIVPLHEYSGIIFLVCMPVHSILNAKILVGYFRKSVSGVLGVFSKEFMVAITCLTLVIAAAAWQGYGRTQRVGENIKLPEIIDVCLENLLEGIGLDYAKAQATLTAEGWIIPEGRYTLTDLARLNKINPRIIYRTIAAGQLQP